MLIVIYECLHFLESLLWDEHCTGVARGSATRIQGYDLCTNNIIMTHNLGGACLGGWRPRHGGAASGMPHLGFFAAHCVDPAPPSVIQSSPSSFITQSSLNHQLNAATCSCNCTLAHTVMSFLITWPRLHHAEDLVMPCMRSSPRVILLLP